jgi:hypothetical protein
MGWPQKGGFTQENDELWWLVGGLEHFLCSPIVGMMIQSD